MTKAAYISCLPESFITRNQMKILFLLHFIHGEIICDYDEPCLKTCTDSVCEYFWNIEHRFTRTWRTQDFGKGRSYSYGALRDVPIEWNTTTGRFDIVQEGINVGALVKVQVKSTLHEESCKLKQQNKSLFFLSYNSLARTAPSR